MAGLYDLKLEAIDKKPVEGKNWKGKAVLFVNTASKCGYTSQFEGLEALHKKYKDKGLVIVGVPSADFNQELASDVEVGEFCKKNYGVSFTMLKTQGVKNKETAGELYKTLLKEGQSIGWNFEKILVNKSGEVVGTFKSSVKPDSEELRKAIDKSLL